MPTSNADIVKRELIIPADVESVWARLEDIRRLGELFAADAAARLEPDDAGGLAGKLRVNATLFKLRMRRYDALATAEGCRLALRLTRAPKGETLATAAVSFTAGCGFSATESELAGFLARLSSAACGERDKNGDAKTIYRSPARAHDSYDDYSADGARAQRPSAQPPAQTKRVNDEPASPKKEKSRAWLAALGIIAAAAAAFALWTFWPFGGSAQGQPLAANDLSGAVTRGNATLLDLGMTRAEVETLFDTEGLRAAAGEYIYRSEEVNGSSQPVVQVKTFYQNDALAAYTVLDLALARQAGAVDVSASAGDYESSMERVYESNGERIVEKHCGYVDPFANFSPSWRGEIALTTNETTGAQSIRYLKGYDGYDPLMIPSLDNKAAANQYDDYDDFLADKLAFDEAMLMVNRYSRGDMARVFGEPEGYDAGSGVKLWRVRKGEADSNGEPLYTYSFRYDSSGAFELGSFSNTRLYTVAGSFEGCKPAEVGPGQSWGEVRYLMPIVPTALFVNDNFYTVCYGRYTGGSEIKYQFELVVSFDIATNVVETVYDNTIPNA